MFMMMLRIKFIAAFIGIIGVGLMANYNALLIVMVTLFNMGLNPVAVREVAAVSANSKLLAKKVIAIKRVSYFLAIFGFLITVFFSGKISQLVFNNFEHKQDVAVLGLAIIFMILTNANTSIIQGVRRVTDLAYTNIFGAIFGTIIALFLFVTFGINSIAWALLAVAVTQMLSSAYFVRRVEIIQIKYYWHENISDLLGLLRNGLPLMISSLVITGTNLTIIAVISQKLDISSAGFYSAAFSLSGVFIGFLLNAMAADYYPRLSSMIDSRRRMNKIVNEQTIVGILLTVPGLLTCLVFSSFLLEIFYSKEFLPASELLQWFILGCFLKVISWPMGFVLLSLGKNNLFFLSELFFNLSHLSLVYYSVMYLSLTETALAFFICYAAYGLFMLLICYKLTKFKWSHNVNNLIFISFIQFTLVFISLKYFVLWLGILIGCICIFLSIFISLKSIVALLGPTNPIIQKLSRLAFLSKWLKI